MGHRTMCMLTASGGKQLTVSETIIFVIVCVPAPFMLSLIGNNFLPLRRHAQDLLQHLQTEEVLPACKGIAEGILGHLRDFLFICDS